DADKFRGDQRGNSEGWKVTATKFSPASSTGTRKSPSLPSRRNTRWKATGTDSTPWTAASSSLATPVRRRRRSTLAMRCDVLIHEARAVEMFARLPEDRRSFGAKNHTTSEQLAALATKAKPGLLVIYHAWISWWPSVEAAGYQPVALATGGLHSTPDVLEKEI